MAKMKRQPDDPGAFEIIGEKPAPKKQAIVLAVLAVFLVALLVFPLFAK